ncbi:helix-turn-helix domain-containing protein [Nocardia sp. NPDC005366]|uniref:helix-turn-helix domain-containing protein n=1 Tax=Nocardia sp. NPDC005366 TaxID=3156878 RepID=UPI0033BFAFC9
MPRSLHELVYGGVHRNTVRKRSTRFAEMTGLDLDRTDDLIVVWWLLNRDPGSRA